MAFQFFTTGSGYQMRTCNYLLTVQGVLVSVLTLLESGLMVLSRNPG